MADLHKKILELLRSQRIGNLATTDGERLLVSAMEFAHDDTRIYLVSIPDTQKLKNIRAHPGVALTINGPGLREPDVRGLQIYGSARIVSDPHEVQRAQNAFFDKNLLDPATHWSRKRSVFIEVSPSRIDVIDYRQGFGHKDTWLPESSS